MRILKKVAGIDGEDIVILDWDGESPQFCNLLKIAANGAVVWTAQPEHPLEGVWSDVEFNDGRLEAYNIAGYHDVIDYTSERILHRRFVK